MASKALTRPLRDIVEARPNGPFNVAEEMPNFELVMTCRRQVGARWPHAVWRIEGRANGRPLEELAQAGRDYMASIVGHIGKRIQGRIAEGRNKREQLVAYAKFTRAEAMLNAQSHADAVLGLLEKFGPAYTASALNLTSHEVKALARQGRKNALQAVLQDLAEDVPAELAVPSGRTLGQVVDKEDSPVPQPNPPPVPSEPSVAGKDARAIDLEVGDVKYGVHNPNATPVGAMG